MSELVTGEAVALELRPARLPSRALAVLLDMVVAVAVYIAVTIALVAFTSSLDDAARTAVSIVTFVLVLVGAPIAVETLSHGRSLGKMTCGLRVVRDDGGPIRFRHALVRGTIGVVEILMTFGVVACIASLVSARGRRLGDVFAGTLVVRERVPAARSGFLPPPPPWLAGRFSGLDLSAVPDELWLAVRQYLTRMHQLDPRVGWAMAKRLATDIAVRTGAPAPQGVPPAAYLAAVLQERQVREARRAFGTGAEVGGAPDGVSRAGDVAVHGGPAAGAPGAFAPPAVPRAEVSAQAAAAQVREVAPAGSRPADPAAVARSVLPRDPSPEDRSAEDRPATGFVPPA
ncbi:membrane protein [Streptomyces fumigatiscleroticus]|nr:membrane protein [Streptomyces fumigatiscleroticus]